MHSCPRRMEQQSKLLTVKICPSPNDDEKCLGCFKNGNCLDFADNMNTPFPIFHKRKHKSPLREVSTQDGRDECTNTMENYYFIDLEVVKL